MPSGNPTADFSGVSGAYYYGDSIPVSINSDEDPNVNYSLIAWEVDGVNASDPPVVPYGVHGSNLSLVFRYQYQTFDGENWSGWTEDAQSSTITVWTLQELRGQIDAVSGDDYTATLGFTISIAGDLAASSGLDGTITRTRMFSGAIAASSSLSASAANTVLVAGDLDASADLSGGLQNTEYLAASLSATGSLAAEIYDNSPTTQLWIMEAGEVFSGHVETAAIVRTR